MWWGERRHCSTPGAFMRTFAPQYCTSSHSSKSSEQVVLLSQFQGARGSALVYVVLALGPSLVSQSPVNL